MARYADGLGVDDDLLAAADAACKDALAGLDGTPDLVLAFVCGDDPTMVAAAGSRIASATGARAMIGCSAGGVLAAGRGVEGRRCVAVWAGLLPDVTLRPFHLEVMRAEEGAAVIGLPERTDEDEVVILLADGWSFPLSGFVKQANDAMPGLPFVGGVAEGRAAGQTRLFVDGRVTDRGAVGVVLGGLSAQVVVSQGCRPVGPPMTVTDAAGNVLRGLAGSVAVERLHQVLSDLPPEEQALASSGLQIGLAMDEYVEEHETGDFLIRAVLGTEPDTGGLVVGDLVPVGNTVRMQVRDAHTADAELQALLHDHGKAGGAIVFSCNGRGGALFGPTHGGADHDENVVRSSLGASGVAGFFGGGEIGPIGGRNHLHGFTASVLCLP